MIRNALLLGTAACALVASSARAERFPDGGVTASEVARVLQDKGYKAEITHDDNGDPLINSSIEGVNFGVYFYDCSGGRCEDIQFAAGFSEAQLTLEKVNAWDRDKRFGRAYLDRQGAPFVEMDIHASHGFESEALASNLDTWDAVVSAFKSYIGA